MEMSPATCFSGAPEADGSIINRKRELKGLPSSFSSNLGYRVSPPRRPSLDNTTPNGGRSVKAIVAWIEASPSSPNPGTPALGGSARGHARIPPSPTVVTSSRSQPNLQGTATDVEEYSLTLLKYRKYFTEQPLQRCLSVETSENGETYTTTLTHRSGEISIHSETQKSDPTSPTKEFLNINVFANMEGTPPSTSNFPQVSRALSGQQSCQDEDSPTFQHSRSPIEIKAF
jgi:hypothetical protein